MLSDEQFSQEVKSKSYVVKQMTDILNNPNFKNLRENLKNDRKKKMIITLSIGGALGLILGFIVGFTSESALIGVVVGVFVFLCSLIGLATIAKSAKNKYAASIAPEVINALYGPNAEYAPNGGYSKEYLVNLDCFPVRTLNQDTLIKGHYFGIPFTVANVESYHYETRGSGKNQRQEKVTDFLGSVMSFRMNKPSKSLIKVMEGSNLFSGKTIDFESSAFNKKFNTYSDDRENAFYIITPQLQLAMLDIEKALPGGLKILFRGDELVIVAAGNTTTFSGINLKESDNYNINVILDSILAPGFVVEKMNLDHKFFLNENDIADLVKKNKENKDEEDKAAIEKALKNNKDALDINKEDIEKIKDTIDSNQ